MHYEKSCRNIGFCPQSIPYHRKQPRGIGRWLSGFGPCAEKGGLKAQTRERIALAVEFAVAVTQQRGKVTESDVNVIRSAGYSDVEIIEIIAHVALNTLANYLNELLGTETDFPAVNKLKTAQRLKLFTKRLQVYETASSSKP